VRERNRVPRTNRQRSRSCGEGQVKRRRGSTGGNEKAPRVGGSIRVKAYQSLICKNEEEKRRPKKGGGASILGHK